MKRRDFLKVTGAMATGVVLDLSGCSSDPAQADSSPPRPDASPRPDSSAPDSAPRPGGALSGEQVLLGLYASSAFASSEDAIRHGLACFDFSWLSSGDSVFVKLSCNSGHAHPAVTSPAAVTALCAELFARGAGKVLVGDQAGVESVRLAIGEKRFGSTEKLMKGNGLYDAIKAAGAEPHFFDDHGYQAGYFEATPPKGHHWQKPMMLPNIVKQVDHIVSLPRLSSHALAGYTHALKSAVGFLRDDSRHHMHNDAASMHEKYTEISYASEIASRLRLVFTFAEKLMLHQGPDTGTLADVDPRIVIASGDIANHDAFSAALLHHFHATIPAAGNPLLIYGDGATADFRNRLFVQSFVQSATGIPWGQGDEPYTQLRGHKYWEGIAADIGLARAYELRGGVPKTIPVKLDGSPLDGALRTALGAFSSGLFDLG
jgi:uncharacterized protein (DUF362 family)